MSDVWKNILNFIVSKGLDILLAIVVYVVGRFVIKLIVKLIKKSKHFQKADPSVSGFVMSFVSVALQLILILTSINILGIPAANFVALLGTAGVAVGLAMQGSLSNLVGGLMILTFKPFKVGDYIDTHKDTGTVEKISIFYTTLLTPDNKKIVIPNNELSNSAVINYSQTGTRRLDLDFTVGYESDIDRVNSLLLACANAHPLSLKEPAAPFARLKAHGDSALVFTLRIWVKSEDYWTVFFDMNETVKKVFDEKGINIPYPQIDVHTKKD